MRRARLGGALRQRVRRSRARPPASAARRPARLRRRVARRRAARSTRALRPAAHRAPRSRHAARAVSVGDELAALRQPRLVFRGALELPFDGDDALLLAMQLGGQRRDRGRGVRDRLLELRGLVGEPLERVALGGDALAQLLDLALGARECRALRPCRRRRRDARRAAHRRRASRRAAAASAPARAPMSNESTMTASPIASRTAASCSPAMRTTLDSSTAPAGSSTAPGPGAIRHAASSRPTPPRPRRHPRRRTRSDRRLPAAPAPGPRRRVRAGAPARAAAARRGRLRRRARSAARPRATSASAPICPTRPLAWTSTMRAASLKPARCASSSSSERSRARQRRELVLARRARRGRAIRARCARWPARIRAPRARSSWRRASRGRGPARRWPRRARGDGALVLGAQIGGLDLEPARAPRRRARAARSPPASAAVSAVTVFITA